MEDVDYRRMIEAFVFAADAPVSERRLKEMLPEEVELQPILDDIQKLYENRGIEFVCVDGAWTFLTAKDLAPQLEQFKQKSVKLSKAAIETLAIIGYHQPITRAEIEEIRGVSISKGTLDILMEADWIKPKGRREVPGRPVTWGTTDLFLQHFGLESIKDLPGVEDLKAAGLLDKRAKPTVIRLANDNDSAPDMFTVDAETLS